MVGIAKEHEIVTQRIKLKKVTFGSFGDGNALAVKGKKKSIVRLEIFKGKLTMNIGLLFSYVLYLKQRVA